MSAALIDIEPLLAPLDGPSPSGAALDYDPRFQALEQAGAGKPERQWGDKIYPAEAPDWPTVLEFALPLAAQSRDLRVAVWLLRCGARLHGLAGAFRGLRLVHGLLTGLWDSVHPQLDASDSNDPTMRLSALAPLLSADAVLADLRAAALAPERGSLTLRDLELGLARAEPSAQETVPTEAGVLQALDGLLQRHAGLADMLRQAHRSALDIGTLVERQIGAARAPDFAPLIQLLQIAAQAVDRVQGQASAARADTNGRALASAPAPVSAGTATSGNIRSRADAVRELERVCDWIERNEPSNPAPLLIRRAQRLMNKSFLDIVRDLAPEGLNQIEHIAGPQAQA